MPRKPATSPRARGHAVTRKPQPLPPSGSADSTQQTAQAATMMFQTPLRLAAVWSQWAEQIQRAGEQTMKGLRQDTEVESEALQRADTPQQMAGLPIGFAAEQAARWAQLSSQVTASLLDIQATWFKDFETVAAKLMTPWFTHDGRIAFGSAQELLEPPDSNGAIPLLSSAQRMWSESAKVWLNAISHDLQSDAGASAR